MSFPLIICDKLSLIIHNIILTEIVIITSGIKKYNKYVYLILNLIYIILNINIQLDTNLLNFNFPYLKKYAFKHKGVLTP